MYKIDSIYENINFIIILIIFNNDMGFHFHINQSGYNVEARCTSYFGN